MAEETANPRSDQSEKPQRREFLKMAVVGVGSTIALVELGSGQPVAGALGSQVDVTSPGVLITKGRGGTVDRTNSRQIYSFDLSAAYALSGDAVSFQSLSLTGVTVAAAVSDAIAISAASGLNGKLDASQCFQLRGQAAVQDSASFASAQVAISGCVVSSKIVDLQGVVTSGDAGQPSLKVSFN